MMRRGDDLRPVVDIMDADRIAYRRSCSGPAWSQSRWLAVGLLLITAALGCDRGFSRGNYAATDFPAKNSINGLGIFEKYCSQSGMQFFQATRLSPRLEQADCILLVGDTFHPPAKEARDWMEGWLARKAGRTVVYFGRDFQANIYYRENTLGQVTPVLAHQGQVDLAGDQAALDRDLYAQTVGDVFCRWFVLRTSRPQRDVVASTGPWAQAINSSNAVWPVRTTLDLPAPGAATPKPTWAVIPQVSVWTGGRNRGRPAADPQNSKKRVIIQSVWLPTDINDDATWESEWRKAPQSQLLLGGSDGTPLVTRLTSNNYSGSQILTIINAAPLLNGSIVQPHFFQVTQKLVEQLGSVRRVAVLPFDTEGISVSEVADQETEVAGLSVLTTWPMNIIIMHLALFGVLICLALFPILGRPQAIRRSAVSDFGQHAEALGQLLRRTGDLRFATTIVAEYIRQVRGEAPPRWLQSAMAQLNPNTTSQPVSPETLLKPPQPDQLQHDQPQPDQQREQPSDQRPAAPSVLEPIVTSELEQPPGTPADDSRPTTAPTPSELQSRQTGSP